MPRKNKRRPSRRRLKWHLLKRVKVYSCKESRKLDDGIRVGKLIAVAEYEGDD